MPSLRAILWVALAAFWLGQALAVVHVARHAGGDTAGLPAHHGQVCTDCASSVPLLAVAGGLAAALLVPRLSGAHRTAAAPAATPARRPHPGFRSRAPPR